ncbi:hypothetical protein C8F04DRAFT_1183715 [Mycena alexandri]|uniref:Uncharacterized protein n=1 Tax=Mycena alexandri TaxID=1745969 RepID=A0AAD6SX62_9AGAR|nr:hypothetical protein C8F04DRAFT_1183715 [Mycena alexandri]
MSIMPSDDSQSERWSKPVARGAASSMHQTCNIRACTAIFISTSIVMAKSQMPKSELYRPSGAYWQEKRRLRALFEQRRRLAQGLPAHQGQIWVLPAPKRGQPSAAIPARRLGPSEADIRSAREDEHLLARLEASKRAREEKEKAALDKSDKKPFLLARLRASDPVYAPAHF